MPFLHGSLFPAAAPPRADIAAAPPLLSPPPPPLWLLSSPVSPAHVPCSQRRERETRGLCRPRRQLRWHRGRSRAQATAAPPAHRPWRLLISRLQASPPLPSPLPLPPPPPPSRWRLPRALLCSWCLTVVPPPSTPTSTPERKAVLSELCRAPRRNRHSKGDGPGERSAQIQIFRQRPAGATTPASCTVSRGVS